MSPVSRAILRVQVTKTELALVYFGIIEKLYRQGGWDSGENRPERLVGFAGGRHFAADVTTDR